MAEIIIHETQKYLSLHDWQVQTENGQRFINQWKTWRQQNQSSLTNDSASDFCTFMEENFYKNCEYLDESEKKMLDRVWESNARLTENEWLVNLLRQAL